MWVCAHELDALRPRVSDPVELKLQVVGCCKLLDGCASSQTHSAFWKSDSWPPSSWSNFKSRHWQIPPFFCVLWGKPWKDVFFTTLNDKAVLLAIELSCTVVSMGFYPSHWRGRIAISRFSVFVYFEVEAPVTQAGLKLDWLSSSDGFYFWLPASTSPCWDYRPVPLFLVYVELVTEPRASCWQG